MKKRKYWLSIPALLLILVMMFSAGESVIPKPVVVSASKVSELQEQKDKLEEDKKKIDEEIKKLEGQLSDNLSSMQDIFNQKSIIDQQIFQLYKQTENLNQQIDTCNLMIADKQEELDDAQERLAKLNAEHKERIRAMEENGNTSYWSVLFKSGSFAELLDSLNMIQEIAASDQRRLEEISAAAQEVADAKAELEAQKLSLGETRKELEAAREALSIRRDEANDLLDKLIASGEEYEKLLEEAEFEQAKIGTELDETADALKKAEYEQWLSTSVPPTTAPRPTQDLPSNANNGTVVGGLTWVQPCNYTAFTSPFGWREHPIYGGQRFHYGVDLAGPIGTPIVATRAGVVTSATYDDSAGYYVVIDHQDGFVTKYLHMTHFIVSPGEYVSAGQKIGEMGSTGASKGSHLHFGVMQNGEYVNPMLYIR